jgi:hypothetical protein
LSGEFPIFPAESAGLLMSGQKMPVRQHLAAFPPNAYMPGTFESDTGGTFNPLPADVHYTLRDNVDLPLPKGMMMHVPEANGVGMLRKMYQLALTRNSCCQLGQFGNKQTSRHLSYVYTKVYSLITACYRAKALSEKMLE